MELMMRTCGTIRVDGMTETAAETMDDWCKKFVNFKVKVYFADSIRKMFGIINILLAFVNDCVKKFCSATVAFELLRASSVDPSA